MKSRFKSPAVKGLITSTYRTSAAPPEMFLNWSCECSDLTERCSSQAAFSCPNMPRQPSNYRVDPKSHGQTFRE